MLFLRRKFLTLPLLAPLGMLPQSLHAQFSNKWIQLVVPASPGTAFDATARFLVGPIGRMLGTSAYVDNRLGANGIIGAEFVARAPADGKTLLMAAISQFTNPLMAQGAALEALIQGMRALEFKGFCSQQAMVSDPADAATFRADIPRELVRWERLIKHVPQK